MYNEIPEPVSCIAKTFLTAMQMKSTITLCTPLSCVLQQCVQSIAEFEASARNGPLCQTESPLKHVDSMVVVFLGAWS